VYEATVVVLLESRTCTEKLAAGAIQRGGGIEHRLGSRCARLWRNSNLQWCAAGHINGRRSGAEGKVIQNLRAVQIHIHRIGDGTGAFVDDLNSGTLRGWWCGDASDSRKREHKFFMRGVGCLVFTRHKVTPRPHGPKVSRRELSRAFQKMFFSRKSVCPDFIICPCEKSVNPDEGNV